MSLFNVFMVVEEALIASIHHLQLKTLEKAYDALEICTIIQKTETEKIEMMRNHRVHIKVVQCLFKFLLQLDVKSMEVKGKENK